MMVGDLVSLSCNSMCNYSNHMYAAFTMVFYIALQDPTVEEDQLNQMEEAPVETVLELEQEAAESADILAKITDEL